MEHAAEMEPRETHPAEGSWRKYRVILRYFRKDVRKRRGALAGGAFFGFVYALARVAEPWPLKVVFDQILFGKPARGLIATLFTPFGSSPYAILVAVGLALGLTGIVRAVAYYYEDFLLSRAAQQIVYAIRTRLYAHLHRLPLSFHQERKTGDMLVWLSSDIILLRDVLVDAIVSLGTGVLLVLMMVTVMALVDPVLTGVALLVMPVIFALSFFYGRRIRVNSQRQRKREQKALRLGTLGGQIRQVHPQGLLGDLVGRIVCEEMHATHDGVGLEHEIAAGWRRQHGAIVAQPEGARMLGERLEMARDQAILGRDWSGSARGHRPTRLSRIRRRAVFRI